MKKSNFKILPSHSNIWGGKKALWHQTNPPTGSLQACQFATSIPWGPRDTWSSIPLGPWSGVGAAHPKTKSHWAFTGNHHQNSTCSLSLSHISCSPQQIRIGNRVPNRVKIQAIECQAREGGEHGLQSLELEQEVKGTLRRWRQHLSAPFLGTVPKGIAGKDLSLLSLHASSILPRFLPQPVASASLHPSGRFPCKVTGTQSRSDKPHSPHPTGQPWQPSSFFILTWLQVAPGSLATTWRWLEY